MQKLFLAIVLCFIAGPAFAQNHTCADRPPGDSSNACANTRFVQAHKIQPGSIQLPVDNALVGNTSNAGAANPLPNCGTGMALQYSTSTHIFSCGSGGSPGGSNTQIQYNNSGSFGGIANGTDGYAMISNGASTPSFQGFVQSGGTNPITRTWQDKATDIVSVKDFAACSGGNDAVGLQNAINFAESIRRSILVNSICRTDTTLNINSPMSMYGENNLISQILVTADVDGISINGNAFASPVTNVTIHDLFIGHTTTNASSAIHIYHAQEVNIQRVKSTISFRFSLIGDGVNQNDVYKINFDHIIYSTGGGSAAIYDQGSAVVWVTNSFFNGNGTANAAVYRKAGTVNQDGLVFAYNTCEQWDRVYYADGATGANLKFIGNLSDRNRVLAYEIRPGTGSTAQQIQFIGNTMSDDTSYATDNSIGIRITNADGGTATNVIATGNIVRLMGLYGMIFTNVGGVQASSNIVSQFSQTSPGTYAAVDTTGSTNVSITGANVAY